MTRLVMTVLRLLPVVALLAAWAAVAPVAYDIVTAPVRDVHTVRISVNPYERGPVPTETGLTAEHGSYAVKKTDVRRNGRNRGTIYAPVDSGEDRFGAVAVAPGSVSPGERIDWLGPRLASQGFVVMTLAAPSATDLPDERADQLLAALDYVTGQSKVRARVDPNRLAVLGHLTGGGGALRAAERRPGLRAAVALGPWHTDRDWGRVRVPTMIMGAGDDAVAPVAAHAQPFYASLTAAPEKAYLELRNAGHTVFNSPNATIAEYSIAWLKRFVDNDARYERFLCPVPKPGRVIGEYRGTCPTGPAQR